MSSWIDRGEIRGTSAAPAAEVTAKIGSNSSGGRGAAGTEAEAATVEGAGTVTTMATEVGRTTEIVTVTNSSGDTNREL